MDELFEVMANLLARVDTGFVRYLYPAINWDGRMLGLVGPRGVGKTTLFLQRIKLAHDTRDTLYASADQLYFSAHTLYETAGEFNRMGGRFLFIDEVHKYPGWSRELKLIYDAYPDLHVYFAGSSILDIARGEADLSRRAPVYSLQGLSFREFLKIRRGIDAPTLTLAQLASHEEEVPGVEHPLPLFKEYLRNGYYPFSSDPDFTVELGQVITRTLEDDIPQYANLSVSTGRKLKRLMSVVSTLAPFKPNMTSLASQIQASRNSLESYLSYMEKAGMVALLPTAAKGIGALGKPEKVYLDNTNILYNLSGGREDIGSVRETFFFNQARVGHRVTSSPVSDFEVDGLTFEVGGRNKTGRQLSGVEDGYIAKDDIEHGYGRTIPLWAFGLCY